MTGVLELLRMTGILMSSTRSSNLHVKHVSIKRRSVFTECTNNSFVSSCLKLICYRKTLTIDPKSLARTKEGIPRRIIDYVIALKSDEITKQA